MRFDRKTDFRAGRIHLDVTADDGANGRTGSSFIFGYDTHITAHDFDTEQLAAHRSVVVGDETFGADTDPQLLIFDFRAVRDGFVADVYFAALCFAFKNIDRRSSEEFCDEQVDRIVVDFLRFSDLLNIAVFHNDDHVRDAHSFFLIMCDEDCRYAGFLLDAADFLTGLQTQARVEVRQRLVEKKHARYFDQGTGDGDTLLLTAGELARFSVHKMVDLYQFCGFEGFVFHDLLRELCAAFQVFKRERDVLAHGEMRVEGVVLEDQADSAVFRRQVRDIGLTEPDLAACGLDQAADKVERGAFAAAGGAEQADELAIRDFKVEVTYGGDVTTDALVAVGVFFCEIF